MILPTRDHLTREQYAKEHHHVVRVVSTALRDADAHPEVAPSALLTLIIELTRALGTTDARHVVAQGLMEAARTLSPADKTH